MYHKIVNQTSNYLCRAEAHLFLMLLYIGMSPKYGLKCYNDNIIQRHFPTLEKKMMNYWINFRYSQFEPLLLFKRNKMNRGVFKGSLKPNNTVSRIGESFVVLTKTCRVQNIRIHLYGNPTGSGAHPWFRIGNSAPYDSSGILIHIIQFYLNQAKSYWILIQYSK